MSLKSIKTGKKEKTYSFDEYLQVFHPSEYLKPKCHQCGRRTPAEFLADYFQNKICLACLKENMVGKKIW